MKTIKTIEKFDKDGNLIERTTETVETIETIPFHPVPFMPMPQPVIIQPYQPYYRQFEITCGSGSICTSTIAGGVQ